MQNDLLNYLKNFFFRLIGIKFYPGYRLYLQFINWHYDCDEEKSHSLELLITSVEVDRNRVCHFDAMVNWSNKKAYINVAGDADQKYFLEIRDKIISILEENGYKINIDEEEFSE